MKRKALIEIISMIGVVITVIIVTLTIYYAIQAKYEYTLEDGTVLKECHGDGNALCYTIYCQNGVSYACQKNFKRVRVN